MNIVCFGAHPDDAEWYAGGTLVKWVRAGHRVLSVALTNGDIGHHEMSGGALAQRRAEESRRCAARAGTISLVLDHHDGELYPSLALRKEIVRIIRNHQADMVLTHRPCDYHPDHRYSAMAVQDAAFMVTVPYFCPDTPVLRRNPVFLYMMDQFTKPTPFQADIAVDVSDVMEVKWSMLDAMASQMYEWLPWLDGKHHLVPEDPAGRLAWLKETWGAFFRSPAESARAALRGRYGDAADAIEYAELFEICEYGHTPTPSEILALFPFLPQTVPGAKAILG